MTKPNRNRYSAQFKAKVALDAIKGELTMAQLVSRHAVHQTMINTWKRQALVSLSTTFETKKPSADKRQEATVEKLHAKIGQLIVERDFLVKASGR